jgi:hypothetical protein
MTISDFDRCLAQLPSPYMCGPSQHEQLRCVWEDGLSSRCGGGIVAADSSDPEKIVQFGFMVFVADRQADDYQACLRPLIARRMLAAWIEGERRFLDRSQIARANAGSGLNLVITHYGRYPGDPRQTIANYEAFRILVRGWKLRTYTVEVFSDPERRDREWGASLGYRVLEYSDDVLRAAGIPKDRAPFLWAATCADAANNRGYGVKLLFDSYAPPRIGLSEFEQDVLGSALDGQTDAAIALQLSISQAAVKKHFRRIYEKVGDADVLNGSFPPAKGSTGRGTEMRRRLLNYLREHPEELRPYAR